MASLTQIQQARLTATYIQDATNRGLDDKAQIRELLNFIFSDRATQKTQLANLVSRVRSLVSDQQAAFDATKAAELSGLNTVGTNLDDLSTTIPTLT
jgi:chorismate mutase